MCRITQEQHKRFCVLMMYSARCGRIPDMRAQAENISTKTQTRLVTMAANMNRRPHFPCLPGNIRSAPRSATRTAFASSASCKDTSLHLSMIAQTLVGLSDVYCRARPACRAYEALLHELTCDCTISQRRNTSIQTIMQATLYLLASLGNVIFWHSVSGATSATMD